MKTVAILGSTGSIGQNALRVISELNGEFKVVALACGSNEVLFTEQISQFKPQMAAIMDQAKLNQLKANLDSDTKLLTGPEGIEQVAGCSADIVLMAIGGAAALLPTLVALKKSPRLALANKECLVMAGDIIMQQAKQLNREIIPVDSEHSAIFQCLKNEQRADIEKIYLTGSGGPLKDLAQEELESVQPDCALAHPRWEMGKKISIDSATLMNKGLEIIEAHYLFGVASEKIQVLIHPQAIVHSLLQFVDGSILAQLGQADMRIPIQYALSYPRRLKNSLAPLDFSQVEKLNFSLPDLTKFPCLKLAIQAAQEKGLSGAVLNACDEECVWAYLDGKIKLTQIARIIEDVLTKLKNKDHPTLDEILATDSWAREEVKKILTSRPANQLTSR
ncbi:MAG: 1-deoxy-D-xylulose-5-phosphate reductoisomerase, partial [Candidatus Omnitrophica bacterium]|nr:1-deoxy-D-xylulose-5-phosphate reductoisomerase [Candidatus Omnitrophota bacterium]